MYVCVCVCVCVRVSVGVFVCSACMCVCEEEVSLLSSINLSLRCPYFIIDRSINRTYCFYLMPIDRLPDITNKDVPD